MFAVTVEKRDRATLIPLIQRYIKPGSIIFSDSWRLYLTIGELPENYTHQMVNHSVEYVNSENGCCTNAIEGTWNGVKRNILVRNYNKKDLDSHLMYFIWKRQNEGHIWHAFLCAIKETHFIDSKDEKKEQALANR